ncbi:MULTISPECIES: Zn-ribbon domain-containing OB-fold protein [Lysinibacillus]|uniref:Zn-ribbon domain-containing OB-fold protein n=1 Tax=Lysinibacillus TaxID=400634 RepID=UPI00289BF575|nr:MULTISPECIES: OB-fold domain-containing protein [Lysinibacillus]MEA0562628.1 OB-fold domain-containing protein [Lysinibacillus irui]
MTYQKPIPVKTQDNEPYWDAADRHELMLQKCEICHAYNHPPGPACAKCGSTELSWENQGTTIMGTIYSYVVSYRPFLPGFQDELPMIIVVIKLDHLQEVKIIGNLLECSPEDIKIGMPVKMIWQAITEDRALPQWILA